MKKNILFEIDALEMNILELGVVVLFLVAAVWSLVKFPGSQSVVLSIFIVGGAMVAYFVGRTDKITSVERRDGFKSLIKYCLHLLWVLPALWCLGSALGWVLAQPYNTLTSVMVGVDIAAVILLLYAIIKSVIGVCRRKKA